VFEVLWKPALGSNYEARVFAYNAKGFSEAVSLQDAALSGAYRLASKTNLTLLLSPGDSKAAQ